MIFRLRSRYTPLKPLQLHLRLYRRNLATLSYASGPLEPPLLHQTVGSHLADIASKHGDRMAVISRHQNIRLTYSALDTLSTQLAHGFKKQGVQKGDRVAISLGNNIEYALSTYALFKLGAILVPLNPSFNRNQIMAALGHLKASHLVMSLESNLPRKPPRSNIELLKQIVAGMETHAAMTASQDVPSLMRVITVNNSFGRLDEMNLKALMSFEDVMADGAGAGELKDQSLDPDEVVNIQFTSGTTSSPKAACLSHKSILNNGKSIGDRMLLTERDIVCCPPPLYHCFGSVVGYLACATHGSAIVFPAECFDPRATVQAVCDEQCTALHGVPTMFLAELELIGAGVVSCEAFRHLRTGIAAGSSVPLELMKKLHENMNLTELSYGMTETSPVSTMTTTNDPLDKRLDSVGRLLPHIEAKIVSPIDRSMLLPIGERGELAVAGYSLQKGYYEDPIRTAQDMMLDQTGKIWMHTGDEAVMDESGYIQITGRIKDLIIRGGENIHPLEIENCLLSHQAIAEASVVGLKDRRYGEAVAAFVRKAEDQDLTEEEVCIWVKERLSHHLVPSYVFWTTAYPTTGSGKIQKFKLRELGEELRSQSG